MTVPYNRYMNSDTVPEEIEEEPTAPLPDESMRELVYGSHLFEDGDIPNVPFGAGGGGPW